MEKKASKKFINKRENVVDEALNGLCLANRELARIEGTQIITLRKKVENKVTLICGGGSGHEPAHGS
jgi:dihydroxyacetone kinase